MARVLLFSLVVSAGFVLGGFLPGFDFGASKHALIIKARTEEVGILESIEAYYQTYGRFPVSSNVQNCATAAKSDFTYGGTFRDRHGLSIRVSSEPASPLLTNDEVIAILMDITNFIVNGQCTVNAGHQLNPKQIIFLNAKLSGDTTSDGVGTDLVYRDPWGNPYVITMNLKDDNQCQDAFYRGQAVSQKDGTNGYFGLFNRADTNGKGSHFAFKGRVMIWSAGPDGRIDPTKSAVDNPNRDNILSWN